MAVLCVLGLVIGRTEITLGQDLDQYQELDLIDAVPGQRLCQESLLRPLSAQSMGADPKISAEQCELGEAHPAGGRHPSLAFLSSIESENGAHRFNGLLDQMLRGFERV